MSASSVDRPATRRNALRSSRSKSPAVPEAGPDRTSYLAIASIVPRAPGLTHPSCPGAPRGSRPGQNAGMSTRPLPSAGFSITIRVSVTADPYAIGRLTTAVGEAGAIVTALDVVDSDQARLIADLTCDTADAGHAAQVTAALEELDGVEVRKVSDRTFLLHLGGKIEVT